jgi:hypothetical protein
MFMNLDGVPAAEGDVRTAHSCQMGELTQIADGTLFSRSPGSDLGPF